MVAVHAWRDCVESVDQDVQFVELLLRLCASPIDV
jgi:hypothetical protein